MTKTPAFTTTYLPLDSLKENPRNPRSHQIDVIDSSLQRFGIVDRITIDERTGQLISGHGRTKALRAMKEAGEAPPEGVTVGPDGQWLVPVNTGWRSRNDAEAAAALIAMNRTSELGGWVDQSLLDLLTELSTSTDGFDGVGFTETDYEDLLAQLADADIPLTSADPDDDDDEKALGSGGGGKAVTIKITDAGLIAAWHDFRDRRKSDDEAMRALLLDGIRPSDDAAADERVRRGRHEDPALEDLEIES